MERIILSFIVFLVASTIFPQDFSRIIEVRDNRMNGPDIIRLQTQLIYYGFNEIGEIDGYYGPMTESVIKRIQYYLGFEQDGKIYKKLWDFLFGDSNDRIFRNINTISKYNLNEFRREINRKMGYSSEGDM
ncbi:MAG: peptidoglycan-binding protein [Treponema sp.]|jgi:peptidoglycan hydrolase-like protein with peptidoglycan-binding domain|nr:peptidoglycan-binding protein [Treponema sp.]